MTNCPDAKLESLFAMLGALGKLRPYSFPVVQMAMGNTMGAEPVATTRTGEDGPWDYTSSVSSARVADSTLPTFQREAEELYMQFRRTEP